MHFGKDEQSPEMFAPLALHAPEMFARPVREVRCACLWMSVVVL
jgi:hypothetical protein